MLLIGYFRKFITLLLLWDTIISSVTILFAVLILNDGDSFYLEGLCQ